MKSPTSILSSVFLGFAVLAAACDKSSSSPSPAPAPASTTTGSASSVAAPQAPASTPIQQPTTPVAPPVVASPSTTATSTSSGTPSSTTSNSSGTPTSGGSSTTVVTSSGGGVVSTSGGGSSGPLALQSYPIGSVYAAQVPSTMHVTEELTTASLNGFDFWHIMGTGPDSDPYYLNSSTCSSGANSITTQVDSAGQPFNYCLLTSPALVQGGPSVQKWLNQFWVGGNHLEIVTNPPVASANPTSLTYVDFNLFDSNYPYMKGSSRFEHFCNGNAIAAFNKSTSTYNIPVMTSYFDQQVDAQIFTCAAGISLPNGQGGLLQQNVTTSTPWVAGIFIPAATLNWPTPFCAPWNAANNCGATYSYPNLMEITVISADPVQMDYEFMANVQQLLQSVLHQTVPLSTN